jgi:3-oxoacyl-[acyl-carrier protein] reductase
MTLAYSGNSALIVGGGCELALCLAPALAEKGIKSVLTFRTGESQARITESLRGHTGSWECRFLDLADRDSIEETFSCFTDGPDYLVDFAQSDYESLVGSADQEKVDRFFQSQISGRSALLKEAGRIMIRRKRGRLVYVSSVAAARPNPGQGFYAASKLAAEALYRNAALELGKFGVTAVTLRPGYIEAGRGRRYIEKNRDSLLKKLPSGMFITAAEVAETLLFLLSDQAKGFNATELTMDGGFTAGK